MSCAVQQSAAFLKTMSAEAFVRYQRCRRRRLAGYVRRVGQGAAERLNRQRHAHDVLRGERQIYRRLFPTTQLPDLPLQAGRPVDFRPAGFPRRGARKPVREFARPRLMVIFDDPEAFEAAMGAESDNHGLAVVNHRRAYASFVCPNGWSEDRFRDSLRPLVRSYGGQVIEDEQFALDDSEGDAWESQLSPVSHAKAQLDDVLAAIGAKDAWRRTRGRGITIALIDTGIHGGHKEFGSARRVGGWAPTGLDPWMDDHGHGTMCACIAAASRADGGHFDGVAPEAGIFAARTNRYASELAMIYDDLMDMAERGEKVVVSNSWGIKSGKPLPPRLPNHPLIRALNDAAGMGIPIFFSAGNNHHLAGGSPQASGPNTIWDYKSRDDIFAAGTCQLDGSMWHYSSRGPGQHFGAAGTNRKPDAVAPTPMNGAVLWGDAAKAVLYWGTSGACPQAAALAALLWSAEPGLSRDALYDIIRNSAVNLGHAPHCQGHGQISCSGAFNLLPGNSI